MYKSLLVLILFTSVTIAAPPTIEAPERVFGEIGDYTFFKVTTSGKGLKIVPLDQGLVLFPSDKLKDSNEIGVRATRPGTYKLLIYTGNADGPSEPKIISIVIGGVLPPSPNPPDPPKPDPIVPPVVDPLYKALKDAYDSDSAADKRERLRALAGVMKDASGYAKDQGILTNQTLVLKVSEQTRDKVGQSLLNVRRAIGAYMNKEFPTEVFQLTAEYRTKFSDVYAKIGKYLEEIGQ